jgi:hypothetical protein
MHWYWIIDVHIVGSSHVPREPPVPVPVPPPPPNAPRMLAVSTQQVSPCPGLHIPPPIGLQPDPGPPIATSLDTSLVDASSPGPPEFEDDPHPVERAAAPHDTKEMAKTTLLALIAPSKVGAHANIDFEKREAGRIRPFSPHFAHASPTPRPGPTHVLAALDATLRPELG